MRGGRDLKANIVRLCLVAVAASLVGACGSVSYVSSELSGSAKPEGGIKDVIPMTRTYKQPPAEVRKAVLAVLLDQGHLLQGDAMGMELRTEPKVMGTGGASLVAYSVRNIVGIDGSAVTYRARFDKKSSVVQPETNLEFPEKENELRRDFFNALDKKLPG
jgi:hypothetical protein